jgi:hypothetical protein
MPTYYKRNTSGTTNWNLATSWSTVSSTSAVNTGTFPSSTTLDPVIFDANSSSVTVNVVSTCTSLDFTSYAATITMTSSISVYGNVTLGTSMGISGTGVLAIRATSTYTSNGVTWPNELQLLAFGNITVTLASLITTVQNLYNTGTSGLNITTVNGNTLNILGNLTMFVILAGSTQINLTGTGTWSVDNINSNEVRNKLNIDTLGTITRGGNGWSYSGPELKYTKGTLVNGSTYLYLSNGGNTSSIISNGVNWGNVYVRGNTVTLTDDMNINNFEFSNNSVVLNGSNLRINSNINLGAGGQILTGTTVIQIIGTGNQTWTTAGATARIGNSMNINKTSGTFTLNGANIAYGTATAVLTYTQGTVVPSTSTFITQTGVTFNITASGFSLNNWSPVVGTYTINTNPLVVNSSLTLAGATTFTGTAGWDCNNLICPTAGTFNITLQQLVTYRTRAAVSITGGLATTVRPTMTSSGASNAIWTLDFGATQSLIYVNGTRIDSSGGQTIWSFGVSAANISTTINWNPGVPLRTVAYTFVN